MLPKIVSGLTAALRRAGLARRRQPVRPSFRPHMEPLEHRDVPAVAGYGLDHFDPNEAPHPHGEVATVLPAGFGQTRLAAGLRDATAMALAPDGRIFITEQGGNVRVVRRGVLQRTPALRLAVDNRFERGLLGIAIDPHFTRNHYIYLHYSVTSPNHHNRVTRFTMRGDRASASSARVLLDLDAQNPNAAHHQGGAIHFGADGKLYVAVGDGSRSDVNPQGLTDRCGKILRINPDGTIPTDNPFYNQAVGDNRAIWAIGLRNPYTFAIQRGSGRIFINDVGAKQYEEINDGVAGGNYGWPATEGPTSGTRFRSPLYSYRRTIKPYRCAVVGAAFYNPVVRQFPRGYVGQYFFGDLCGGVLQRLDPTTRKVTTFATGLKYMVDVSVSNSGYLYYLTRGGFSGNQGELYRVSYQRR
jgi:glucose/arabinose dehydrogenase